MKVSGLDMMLTKLTPVWFLYENPSPFLLVHTSANSHQVLGICSRVQTDLRTFLSCSINNTSAYLTRDENHPSDPFVLCIQDWYLCSVSSETTSKMSTVPTVQLI